MKQGLQLGLSQTLTMTPALQQAIRMLQLSTLDLKTEIQEALESNVMLEADDGREEIENAAEPARTGESDAEASSPEIPDSLPVDADWSDIYGAPTTSAPAPTADDEDYWEYRQASLTATPDLASHLAWQADMYSFAADERAIADYLIDAVDTRGLLCGYAELVERLCIEFDCERDTIDGVLAVIQRFDPAGVAARGLPECLTLQLEQLEQRTAGRALALRILEEISLESLAASDSWALAERLGVSIERLDVALALIRSLDPSPGDAFGEQSADYVVPEVFVTRDAARWQVALNAEIAPRLRINSEYLALIKRADRSADQTTLKSHLQEARFFLNSLKSRNDTLLQVAQTIVEAQRAFLEYGEEAMKPLVLRDVAEKLEIHESTVSRATANKYMQTPRGIFELKYFFSSHVSTTDGGSASATAIQAMIRRMVAAETPGKPLSDSKLAQHLLDSGIQVARRTVAKYREALSIPPSHERKRRAG